MVEKYTGYHWLQLCEIDAHGFFLTIPLAMDSTSLEKIVQLQESLERCTCGAIRKPSGYICLDLQVTPSCGELLALAMTLQ